LLGW